LFNDVHPSPIPMITRYFNYYDQGRLFRTVNEDIFLKKLPNKDVLNVIEQCHGLVAVIKSLKLDMDILGMKIEDIDFKNINQEFFDTFISTKQALDRIRNKSNQGAMNAYLKLYQQEQLTENEAIHINYLKKVGLVSEDNKLKGSILGAYLKLYLKKAVIEPKQIPVEISQKVEEPKVREQIESVSRFNPSEFYLINDHIQINKSTGEIFFKHKISAEYLTEKELIVFMTLYESINQNVSKETLGNHIWGQESDQYYSEWAIDKLVSRIREKIDDIKPFKVIKTIRNKGYCLISNTKLEE